MPARRPVVVAGTLVFAALVLLNAWVADDAYITFRTIEAALRGDGLVWNPGERVMAYTHPLWMLALLALAALGLSVYAAALSLGVTLSVLSAWKLLARAPRWAVALALAAALASSKTILHFATSGLEGPLVVWLVLSIAERAERDRRASALRRLSMLGAALVLTRMDAALLVLPLFGYVVWRAGGSARDHLSEDERATLANVGPLGRPRVDPAERGALGSMRTPSRESAGRRLWRGMVASLRAARPALVVLLGWFAFATVYYGHPLPNTALAKLGTGLPRAEVLSQGGTYLASAMFWDPVSVAVVFFGIFVGLRQVRRAPIAGALALGALLYVAYVVWIGGDFMNGRFFLAPAWVALWVLGSTAAPRAVELPRAAGSDDPLAPGIAAPGIAGPGVVAVSVAEPARAAGSASPRNRPSAVVPLVAAGALLAVGYSFPERTPLDVLSPRVPWGPLAMGSRSGIGDEQRYYLPATGLWHGHHPPDRDDYLVGRALGLRETRRAIAVGFLGYGAAERGVVVDPIALTDPFLARFPVAKDRGWRVGHAARAVPDGYEASLREGVCRMRDEALCSAWRDVWSVTHDPVLSGARLKAWWRVVTGRFADGIDVEHVFVRPTLVTATRLPALFDDAGVELHLADLGDEVRAVRLTLDAASYAVHCRRGGRTLHVVELSRSAAPDAIASHELGCEGDTLLIEPSERHHGRDHFVLHAAEPR